MSVRVIIGDVREQLRELPDQSVNCIVTSPPYFGLRDYGMAAQIGLEATPAAYVETMVEVFREARRVLRDDGTLWLNLGDSYNNRTKVRTTSHQPALNGFTDDNWAERAAAGGVRMSNKFDGIKEKDLIGIPWRVAFALQADGWWLRQDIIWHKPNPMPESVTDRCTKAHEYVFLLSKSARYWFDAAAIAEPQLTGETARYYGTSGQLGWNAASGGHRDKSGSYGNGETRNKRSVWTITSQPFADAHFATFPPELPELCIKASCPVGGTVLDPFGGAGTTGLVADRLQRHAILIELNPDYATMAEHRITDDAPLFMEPAA
jgi:DNA modification methylase